MSDFVAWPKTPRWTAEGITITEKIDGTNAQIYIHDDGETIEVGSRNRWITPEADNYGFARFVSEHREEILTLGHGRHFGEWWGSGIQRGYDMQGKVFSLFNTARPRESLPDQVSVVPVLYHGPYDATAIDQCVNMLKEKGSQAAPGYMNAEGICIYFHRSHQIYKIPFNK